MTATMRPTADLAAAMAEAAAAAVQQATGFEVSIAAPVRTAEVAPGDGDYAMARSMLTVGPGDGGLVTVVPSSGLASAEGGIEATRLIATLAQGAAAGLTRLLGAPVQVAPAVPLSAPAEIDGDGAETYEVEIKTDSAAITVRWVVEAPLGALLAGGDPVDPPAGEEPSVAPATLPELTPSAVSSGRARDLQLLADVPMNVSVEIGRGSIQVRELLSLVQGSIVELDRIVGAPVDVLVNGTLVAHGDIVVVGDDLGVRITEIVEPV